MSDSLPGWVSGFSWHKAFDFFSLLYFRWVVTEAESFFWKRLLGYEARIHGFEASGVKHCFRDVRERKLKHG